MLIGDTAETLIGAQQKTPISDVPQKSTVVRKRKRRTTKAANTDDKLLAESHAADGHSAHIDPVLLQIARDYDVLAQDQEFSRRFPMSAGVMREVVGFDPMRATTPEVLRVLRDIWGQVRPAPSH